MRIAAIILVIIGALLSIGLGVKWLSDISSFQDQLHAMSSTLGNLSASKEVSESLKEIERLKICAIFLIVGAVASVVMVFLAGRIKTIAGIATIAVGVIPGVLNPLAFVVTFLSILGGVFVLVSKPKRA